MYRVTQNPEIFSQASDVFSVIGEKTVKALFSKAKQVEIKSEKTGKDIPVSVLAVPCSVDSGTFYAFFARYGNGLTDVGILTGVEYKEYVEDLVEEDDRLPAEAFGPLKKRLPLYEQELSVVDPSDKSVRLVLSFLEKAEAKRVKAQLNRLTEDGKLLITDGPVLAAGGIVVDQEWGSDHAK